MAQQIKVHVLSNDEFDSLPESKTRGSDISNSLGFANPFTNEAFVRFTESHELNKFLINHEIEELIGPGHEGHEDENGIRHKSGFLNIGGKRRAEENRRRDEEQARQREAQRAAAFAAQAPQAGALGQFSTPGAAGAVAPQGASGGPAGGLSTGLGQQGLGGLSQGTRDRVRAVFGGTGRALF